MNGQKNKSLDLSRVLVTKSNIQGKGLFSLKPIIENQQIGYFEGHEIINPTKHSVTFEGKIIEPTCSLKYLNHSCAPNALFRGRFLMSLHDIKVNEEITIDYLATESILSNAFKCKCSSIQCRGWIGSVNV